MKRFLKYALITLLALAALAVAGPWLARKGMSPLVDGETLAGGRIVAAVDATSPMPVAAYVLRLGDGKFALVDTGMDPQAKAVRATLARLGATEADVEAVFVTHLHGDHTGGIASFPRAVRYRLEVPGAPVPAGSTARRLRDGDTVTLGRDTLQAFAVPGHTPESGAYLIFGVLFLGDAAAGQYNGRIGGPPLFVSADRKRGQASLKALAARLQAPGIQVDALAFGHQGPLKGLAPLVAWAKDH
ncbi:MAG TPA: MBL fold metallo-hydrolase [Holophaga sp.]|nr:MBL fold metallo-hydrolase [Holophaga sp.]